jgi:lipopolysaccharide transport system ATP-binding protein
MRPAIRVIDVSKHYAIGRGRRHDTMRDLVVDRLRRPLGTRMATDASTIWALRGVSLEIDAGEVVGIVGRNGAGKSTLLKILSRITAPTKGRAEIRGRVGSLLEVGTGFHPELTGRENVFMNGSILGMTQREVRQKFDDIVAFAEVERFIDTPIKRYSSGMAVRLAFAVAAHFEPEVLLVDEVLSVGDAEFQRRCLGRVREISQGGRTVLFVSHNLAAVSALCTRAYLFDGGAITAQGEVNSVLQSYADATRKAASVSLRDRRDRTGSGILEFTEVAVSGPSGAIRVGDPATVQFRYTATEAQRDVVIAFAVFGPLGDPLFHCKSRDVGVSFSVEPGEGVVSCTIPTLPLLPGVYSINIFASAGNDENVLDWVENAASIDILESDYLGNGFLPSASHGHYVVRHRWSD